MLLNELKWFGSQLTAERKRREAAVARTDQEVAQDPDIQLAQAVVDQGEKRVPADAKLVKELRQVVNFALEHNLHRAHSWLIDMWHEYREPKQ